MVYVANQDTAMVPELYSVPIGGPAAAVTKLNGAVVAGGNVSAYFLISPDSSRVVYRANQQTASVAELYSAPIGGPAGSEVKLNGALVPGGNVTFFQVSPDSSRVVYLADQQMDNVVELHSVPIGVRRGLESSSTGPWWPAGMYLPFSSVRIADGWFMWPTKIRLPSLNYTASPSGSGGVRGQAQRGTGGRRECE